VPGRYRASRFPERSIASIRRSCTTPATTYNTGVLPEPELGSTENSYAIIAKLATGGMAEIYLARTASGAGVERYVVLKRILRHRATDIKFVHMFLDEARLAAQLQHPNIAQVYDTGKLGDSYFFTMEYVHGETVRELLYRAYSAGHLIPLGCVLTIIAGAAAGLQHAHERIGVDGKPLNIVHRDVSPSNLMISYDGHVKLVDFGVAKADHQSVETQSGTIKGKIGYMAPEQCRGGMVDARCDLFSLGIVMWELLTGDRLFKRATDYETMEAIVRTEVVPPSSYRPELPFEVDAIVMRLLAKHPDDRFQSAEEVHEAIESAAASAQLPLSNATLRRYVRELFGPRSEPWHELKERPDAEVVTVTGVPILDPAADPIDHQLDNVIDLSPASERAELPSRIAEEATAPTVSAIATPLRRSAPLEKPIVLRHPSGPLRQPEPDLEPASSSRWRNIGIAAVLAASIAVVVIYLTSRSSTEPATRPPSPPVTPVAIADARASVDAPLESVDAMPPQPADAVLAMFARGEFEAVVHTCRTEPEALVAHVALCVQAACKHHDDQLARRWFERIPDHRATIDLCHEQGLVLEVKKRPAKVPKPPPVIKPTKPDCSDDPMACR
jgi:serine/threonine protein kinase